MSNRYPITGGLVRPDFLARRAGPIVSGFLILGLSARPAAGQTAAPQDQLWDFSMSGDTVALASALQHGAAIDSLDTRRNPNGRRALNWAAWYNQAAAIRFLVARGAKVNIGNRTGFTPLHHAAEHGSLDAARALVALGADPTILNNDGQKPADVSRERSHPDITALLDSLQTR
jgi:ankyrin repeat protein